MKLSLTIILTLAGLATSAGDTNQGTAKIKVYENPSKKIYTVFFADTAVHDISVKLRDRLGTVILEEDFKGKGFSQKYGLDKLKNGKYEFLISYDGVSVSKPIELKSEKALLAESVQVEQGYPTLKVTIKPDNLSPINIMLYNMKDELQKIFYWEPRTDFLTREIDLSQFEGYEARIEVIQEEIQKLDQLVLLY